MASAVTEAPVTQEKLVRGLGLLDSTMLVAGSMIGSGIFIVSSIIARQVGSSGLVTCCLGRDGIADTDSGALVRRTRSDDAEGGRPIRLSSRSILAAVGISLRLDALSCNSNGHNCGGGSWIWALYGCAHPVGVGG